MTENLNIKVVVDTSAVKASVRQAQNSLKGIGNHRLINPANKADANALNGAMVNIQGTMESIKRLSFGGLLVNLWSGLKESKTARKSLKEMRKELRAYQRNLRSAIKTVKQYEKSVRLAKKHKLKFDIDGDGKKAIDKIKGQIAGLKTDIGDGKQIINLQWLKILSASLASILAVIGAIIVALGVLASNALKVAQQMRRMTNEARRIGMSLQGYQKWGYVIEQVGGDAEDLTDFIKTLSSEQVKLREGNAETAKSFKKLGISVEKASKMGQEELFEETIRGLRGIEDQVERTSLAFKIFGEEDAVKLTNVLALSNKEIDTMLHNYELLGGYASETLISRSYELTSAINDLKVAWQGIKNVLAEAVLPAVNIIMKLLVKWVAIVRMFWATVLNTDTKIGGASKLDQATGSVNKYEGAINGATSAVQKLKRSTMGFDELNVVPDPRKNLSALEGIDYDKYIPEVPDYDSLIPSVEDLGLDKFAEFFERNKKAIEDWSTGLITALGIIMAIAGFATGNFPIGIIGLAVAGLGISIGMGEGGTWERLGQKIKEWGSDLGEFFSGLWSDMKQWGIDTWHSIKDWGIESWKKIKETWTGCKEWFAEKWEGIKEAWKNAPEWFSQKWEDIKEGLVELKENFGLKFNEAWGKVKTAFSPITGYFREKWQSIKNTFSPVAEFFRQHFGDGWTNIRTAFGNFNQFFRDKWQDLKDGIHDIPEYFREKFGNAWEKVKEIFAPWADFFGGLWETIKQKFTSIGSTIANAVGGGVKSVINSVLSHVERTVNNLIGMLNNAIRWINKLPGINFGYLNTISVPRMATGGIVSKSTLANIGENGREAVLPLENNTGWMDKLADKINARNANAPTKVVLTVDGRELGWATINNINSITKQTGGLQLSL